MKTKHSTSRKSPDNAPGSSRKGKKAGARSAERRNRRVEKPKLTAKVARRDGTGRFCRTPKDLTHTMFEGDAVAIKSDGAKVLRGDSFGTHYLLRTGRTIWIPNFDMDPIAY